MRRLLPCTLGLLLATAALGCAAPADEEIGSAEGAAGVGETVSMEEAVLLRDGSGLTCDGTTEDGLLLCSHDRGLVVLSDQGIALLQAKGDDVTAKARAQDASEKHDVADVLEAGNAGGTTTQGLRPQGLLGGRVLVDLVEALVRSSRRAVVNETEVAAARSAEKAGNLVALQKELRAGQSVYRSTAGATVLAGKTPGATIDVTTKWAKATGRRIFGVRLPGLGRTTTRENVEAFMALMRAEATKLSPGEKLTILYSPTIGSTAVFVELAQREGFDVLFYSPADAVGRLVPHGFVVPPGNINNGFDDSLVERIAERVYQVDTRFVGPL